MKLKKCISVCFIALIAVNLGIIGSASSHASHNMQKSLSSQKATKQSTTNQNKQTKSQLPHTYMIKGEINVKALPMGDYEYRVTQGKSDTFQWRMGKVSGLTGIEGVPAKGDGWTSFAMPISTLPHDRKPPTTLELGAFDPGDGSEMFHKTNTLIIPLNDAAINKKFKNNKVYRNVILTKQGTISQSRQKKSQPKKLPAIRTYLITGETCVSKGKYRYEVEELLQGTGIAKGGRSGWARLVEYISVPDSPKNSLKTIDLFEENEGKAIIAHKLTIPLDHSATKKTFANKGFRNVKITQINTW